MSRKLCLLSVCCCFFINGMERSDRVVFGEEEIQLGRPYTSFALDDSSDLAGVCRENEPFYDWKDTYVESKSMLVVVAIPINNGSLIVYKKENIFDATGRLINLTKKLAEIRLEQQDIPLENKVKICDAIIKSAIYVLNTLHYWASFGYKKFRFLPNENSNEVKEYVSEIRKDLVGSSGCIPKRVFPRSWCGVGCDVAEEVMEIIPEGVFPYDVPRHLKYGVTRYVAVDMKTLFFKLVSVTGEVQKINVMEGLKILDSWKSNFINTKLNQQSIPLDEKIAICDSIINSSTNILNAIHYWVERMSGWDASLPFFGDPFEDATDLKECISEIRERLLGNSHPPIHPRKESISEIRERLLGNSHTCTLPIPPQPEMGGVARPSKDTVTLPILTQPKVGRVARSSKGAVNPPFRKVGSSRLTPLPPLSSAPTPRRVVKPWSSDSD
ncbi:MAG: hypothetical protein LBJ96_05285 [Holosporaceae bacterium]|jgi:hypothetical protein|nr:hypothetical protein [Holosporaceae bacterium]